MQGENQENNEADSSESSKAAASRKWFADRFQKLRTKGSAQYHAFTSWLGEKAKWRGLKVGPSAPPSSPSWILRAIANDTFLGFLLGAVVAYLLTAATYYFLNEHVITTAPKSYRVWRPYTFEELAASFQAATGEPLSAGTVQQALQEIAAYPDLHLTLEYDYTERDSFERIANDVEFEEKRAKRITALLEDWPGLREADAKSLVMSNRDDTKLVLRDENLKSLWPIAKQRPVRSFRFRWGKSDEFGHRLTLERIDDNPLSVRATYEPLLAEQGSADTASLQPQRTIVPSEFDVVSESTVALCWRLRPIAVQQNAKSLAGQFFPLMNKNIRGLTLNGKAVAEQDYAKLENNEEEFVTFLFTQLIGRRLSPVVDSDEDSFSTFVAPDARLSPKANTASPIAFADPTRLFAWRRVFNGSDHWGAIQYITIWCFIYLMLLLTAKWRLAGIQYSYLRRPAIFRKFNSKRDIKDAVDNRLQMIEGLRSVYRGSDLEKRNPDRLCIPLEIMYAGCSGMSRGGHTNVPSFVNARSTHLLERIVTSFTMVRYFAWALPSIGFVGTVLGIGNALLGTGGVLAEDRFAQQASIQGMAQTLGTAFDTTFVALVLSIVAVAGIHVVQRSFESLVHDSVDRATSALIDPAQQFLEVREPARREKLQSGKAVEETAAGETESVSPPTFIPKTLEPMTRVSASLWRDLIVFAFVAAALLSALSVIFPTSVLGEKRRELTPQVLQLLSLETNAEVPTNGD